MGLDFTIEKKIKGDAYESSAWEDMAYTRNGWKARDIVLNSISTYDKEHCVATLSFGTLVEIAKKLVDYLANNNLNDKYIIADENFYKTARFAGELLQGIGDCAAELNFEDIEYEFMLNDSY